MGWILSTRVRVVGTRRLLTRRFGGAEEDGGVILAGEHRHEERHWMLREGTAGYRSRVALLPRRAYFVPIAAIYKV
jgi:hypothetical protein